MKLNQCLKTHKNMKEVESAVESLRIKIWESLTQEQKLEFEPQFLEAMAKEEDNYFKKWSDGYEEGLDDGLYK